MSLINISTTSTIKYKPVVSKSNWLNNDQIRLIENYTSKIPTIKGEVTGNNQQMRDHKIKWLKLAPEIEWLYEYMWKAAMESNSMFFHLDLQEGETIQYTIYDIPGNKIGQHKDNFCIGPYDRKLSCIVQLSDPTEYEGGDVKIYVSSLDKPTNISKEKGSIHFFNSYLIHEVTPVTKGIRKSLVWWISGPTLR